MLAIGKGGYSALRRGRASTIGQAYLVTSTTENRRPLFANFENGARFCSALHGLQLWRRHRLRCWVLMPDHFHCLVELGEGENLPALVQKLKANTSRAIRDADPEIGQVWARGFHEHAVRSDESLVDVARYVVANPVRASLVDRAGRYPFWNADWLDAGKDRD